MYLKDLTYFICQKDMCPIGTINFKSQQRISAIITKIHQFQQLPFTFSHITSGKAPNRYVLGDANTATPTKKMINVRKNSSN